MLVVLLCVLGAVGASRVVFKDDFNEWNSSLYHVAVTANGGGNGEFQVYTPESKNLYTHSGNLYIRPTFTVDDDRFTENSLYHSAMDVNKLWGTCTNSDAWGCLKTGSPGGDIIPPIMSGRIRTKTSIKYGRVNVRAKIPQGDWLWPAIWMLPTDWSYGGWPRSGEIDIMESRGNLQVIQGGVNRGVNHVSSTLHWGPAWNQNGWGHTHHEKFSSTGTYHGWHMYSLDWYEDRIVTYVDNQQILRVDTPGGGFWSLGGFGGSNIWSSGGRNAPFDKQFQLILNVAVGGGFFPNDAQYNTPKPWHPSSHDLKSFWEGRHNWQPTWHGEDVAMAIDYIEMIQA